MRAPKPAIVLQCEAAPLATRYRWRMRLLLAGVTTSYQLAARSVAPLATIATLPPGQSVEIIVQAVNGNLQGVASEPLVFTMPHPMSKAPERKAIVEPLDLPTARITGNGNGNGLHARAA